MTSSMTLDRLPQVTLDGLVEEAAQKAFQTHGCLEIKDFLPVPVIRALHDEAIACHAACLETGDFARVGDKRRMIALPVRGGFGDARLFSSEPLAVLLNGLLGASHVINFYGCVVSQPGATAQHVHTDTEGLFGTGLDYLAPCHAINLFVPLVPLNQVNGTTQMWPGTHRKPMVDHESQPGLLPEVPLGSAILMDYRVLHRGRENLSLAPRPILTIAFSRKWFIDTQNFVRIAPIKIAKEDFERLPPDQRALFARAKLYWGDKA